MKTPALLLAGSLFFAPAALAVGAHADSSHHHAVRLARGPTKHRVTKKEREKEKEKAKEEKLGPENAQHDPRASAPAAADAGGPPVELHHGPSRIEFDDRLIQGQTNKANAIYLFERREVQLRSLLKKRTNFHEEIDETLE